MLYHLFSFALCTLTRSSSVSKKRPTLSMWIWIPWRKEDRKKLHFRVWLGPGWRPVNGKAMYTQTDVIWHATPPMPDANLIWLDTQLWPLLHYHLSIALHIFLLLSSFLCPVLSTRQAAHGCQILNPSQNTLNFCFSISQPPRCHNSLKLCHLKHQHQTKENCMIIYRL